MTDFSQGELRRLDLTLLLVFLGLLRHRKATDVAAELGLTQSGVSQALKRLRDIFGDPLFLRLSNWPKNWVCSYWPKWCLVLVQTL